MVFTDVEKQYMEEVFTKDNSGYVPIANALLRCLFLTSSAKFVYALLAGYCYGDKRECYPTLDLLALDAQRTTKWISEYIGELEEAGLLTVSKTKFGNNLYVFKELHKSKEILHSEAVWSAMYRLKTEGITLDNQFDTATRYLDSELCKEVKNSDYPLRYDDRIYDYFCKDLNIENKDKQSTCNSIFILDERLVDEINRVISFYYETCEEKYEDKCQTEKDFKYAVIAWKHVYVGDDKRMANDLEEYICSRSKEESSLVNFLTDVCKKYLGDETYTLLAQRYNV